MFKVFSLWNVCLTVPAVVLASLLAGESASANPSPEVSQPSNSSYVDSASTNGLTTESVDSLRYPNIPDSYYDMVPVQETDPSMLQVTSVTQLSDVQPTDWAYQSLQSLVERYGCVVGYPDGTFRGNRPLSRYEFAAGLNACMDRVNELVAQGLAPLGGDLETFKRLQEEFAAELATLKGRVDSLEARTSVLESQQFSTTTKLSGAVFFNLTGLTGGENVRRELHTAGFAGNVVGGNPNVTRLGYNPNVTFSNLAWLTLFTSFSGKDQLITQLAVGNGLSPANALISGANFFNTWGVPFTDQTAGTAGSQFILRELSYAFPVGENLRVVVGPRINIYRYFDDNRYTFILSGVSSFNGSGSTLFNGVDRGAGAVGILKLSDQFDVRVGYFGQATEFLPPAATTANDPATGLFGGLNTAIAELDFYPSKDLTFRFTYARTNQSIGGGQFAGATEPVTGIFNFGAGNNGTNVSSDTFLANFDWKIGSSFGLFGRYGIGFSALNTSNAGNVGSITTQSVQFGAAFPDLGKKGALGTISFLVPFDVTSGRQFLAAGAAQQAGLSYSTQYEIEANYSYPLSDNIKINPALMVIFNPNNISGNPTVFVYNLRTQFFF